MSKRSFSDINCPIAQTLDQVGEWWTFLILRNAFCGMTRFHEFQHHLGISTNVLAQRLDKLTASGVFERRVAPDDGRSFEYRLTDKGHALYPILAAMIEWGEKWAAHPDGPRLRLVERATRRPIAGVSIRSADDEALQPADIDTISGPGADEKTHEMMRVRAAPPREP
ncbi:transcriptional regulator [Burkholderia sp. Bp8963]|uniref:winged helix-turn-helix transcriptional regulator n=1 Tax=Burkholderia sp. Bp8963 TaxID=2184547 RepID=UPI000F59383E|nr:helix-turn-helix domain-containing protein [Burkholderia sp. Bp8963]RQS75485.1 transcriptional regulator [Burkholderia sp. Bp8963]